MCASCHGAAGDGSGRLGIRQEPKPRDFAQGIIKFASVPAGALWRDEDVLRTLKRGLKGTQMIAIKLPDADLRAVTHYIKTFSPRWRDEQPGESVEIPTDPYTDADARSRALVRGAELYTEKCAVCHDAQREVETIWRAPVKSPNLVSYTPKAGDDPRTLYRTLAAGLGGIEGKEGLAGDLAPKDIWALVHHVDTLLD